MTFQLTYRHRFDDPACEVSVYRHEPSGLRHLHVACDDPEAAVVVGVPTLLESNNGVAHVLEHLCVVGSRRYPVRGLLSVLYPRTTATFLNASTDVDCTIYQAASRDPKECLELMDVLVDAVLDPLLNPLDFLQEGWRLGEGENPVLDGVVFNEMLGHDGDADRAVFLEMRRRLMPFAPFLHCPGGDPSAIPSLTHEEVRAFHCRYYHPGHTVVATYGSLDPDAVRRRLADRLAQTPWPDPQPLPDVRSVPPVPGRYPVALPVTDASGSRLVRAWRLTESPDRCLEAWLVGTAMGDSGTTLGSSLEQQGVGRLRQCGSAGSSDFPAFAFELEGFPADSLERAKEAMGGVLQRAMLGGIRPADIASAFRDVEIALRRRGEDDRPHGIDVLEQALSSLRQTGSPDCGIRDLERLAALRADLGTPDRMADWVRRHLVENPSCVEIEAHPDPEWFSRRAAQMERVREEAHGKTLPAERDRQRAAWEAHRSAACSPSSLPYTPVSRMALAPPVRPPVHSSVRHGRSVRYAPATVGGIVRLGVSFDASEASLADQQWADLALALAWHVGTDRQAWGKTVQRRAASGLEWEAGLHVHCGVDSPKKATVLGKLSGLALARDHRALGASLREVVQSARFREPRRVAYLLDGMIANWTGDPEAFGDEAAGRRARLHVHPVFAAEEAHAGHPALVHLLHCRNDLRRGRSSTVLDHLEAAMERLRSAPCTAWAWGDGAEEAVNGLSESLASWAKPGPLPSTRPCPAGALVRTHSAFFTDTSVNYVHEAFPVPQRDEDGGAAAWVLSHLLTDAFLLPLLREKGGAYSAEAAYKGTGVLCLGSFRDPRLTGTYGDYAAAIESVVEGRFSGAAWDDALRASLRTMVAVPSPEEAAESALGDAARGFSPAIEARFLNQIRDVSPRDVRGVAERCLTPGLSVRAATVGWKHQAEAEECGMKGTALFPPSRLR